MSHALTITDLFCGAGGSSTGAIQVPGVAVRMAANHWPLAVETHNTNHPDADHDCADLSQVDPRRYPRTDILWASPECTNHSQAKGRKRVTAQPDLFDELLPDEAAERSRATMWDVVRFAEVHRYRAVIVENVVDSYHWPPFQAWLMAMASYGYEHQLVFLNSMHAQAMGMPAPQSRDRQYVVFWRQGERRPDLERFQRPAAYCSGCDEIVPAMQSWKRADRAPWGRYRQQYVYRCPRVTCRNQIVEPAWLPAAAAIDWTLPGTRIGDRAKPLAPKTRARIQAGIDRYWSPIHLEAAGHTYDSADPKHSQHGRPGAYMRAWPITEPLKTIHTLESKALAYDPLMVPLEGRDGKDASPSSQPMRTQTTRHETAVGFPPFLAELRGGGSTARPASDPLATVTAGGNHHGLVMTNTHANRARPAVEPAPTMTTASGGGHGLVVPAGGTWNDDARSTDDAHRTMVTRESYGLVMRNNTGAAEMSTPVSEPLRTITTAGHQSLLVPYNSRGRTAPTTEPHRTMTTLDRYALADGGPSLDVDDVLFRMLEPHEVIAAMAFPGDYVVLGTRRERVRMAGNAVTPPAARDLIACVVEAITGETIEMQAWGVAA
ncbi:DNA cytosine methyltransferase [Oerskovia jenensis]|uniref:DNA cytosine methyltransferase n=1 Tax=Oerskovia jenensis TaxID=162169 RepID=UPI0036DD98AA